MYNFNYEYMTFLYVVHVYMFCNVVLYCIALPARVLFAIKIIIIIIIISIAYLIFERCRSVHLECIEQYPFIRSLYLCTRSSYIYVSNICLK
jgi:hypothetical protein